MEQPTPQQVRGLALVVLAALLWAAWRVWRSW
jgi:hypothetical protein